MKRTNMGVLIAPVLVLLFLGGCFLLIRTDVTGQDAHKLVADGARLVDVRSPDEYAKGHIDGAVNVWVSELPKRLGELEPKDKPIVVYCHTGIRATRAMKILREAGFSQVHNLGAMSSW
jgi:phage shock protein E